MELLDSWLRVFLKRPALGMQWYGSHRFLWGKLNVFSVMVCALSDNSILFVGQWLRILSKSIHRSVKAPNVAHQKMACSFSKAFVFRVQAGSPWLLLPHSWSCSVFEWTLWTLNPQRFCLVLWIFRFWVREGLNIKWSWSSQMVLVVFLTITFFGFAPQF